MTGFSFARSNDYAEIASTGTSAATGTAITSGVNMVITGTTSTADSVTLPTSWAAGDQIVVMNVVGRAGATGAIVKVWPPTGHSINTEAADAAISLADGESAIFIKGDGAYWGAIIGSAN